MNASIGLEQLLEWVLRSSLIIVAIALTATLLRKRAASSMRHALWAFAITASLALPLLSLALPAWHILPARHVSGEPVPGGIEARQRTTISIPTSDSATLDTGETVPEARVESIAAASINWPHLVLSIWAAGLSFCLLRLLVAHSALRKLVHRRSHACQVLSEQFSCNIRLSYRHLPPMVCGLLRPTILLPSTALDWPRSRLQAVVEHEQAHIRRCDLPWACLASILCALQWFNPLAWLATRQMRSESEHACDDAVILGGVPAKEYAGHLLEVASMLEQPHKSLPVAAMASGPEVEGRLRYALDTRRDRSSLGKRRALGMAILLAPIASAVALAAESEEPPVAASQAEAEQQPAPEIKVVPRKIQTIVLDPGHGGNDTGAGKEPGPTEKDFTLKLALSLRERLEKAGFRVVLTRFDDSAVSLPERTEIANKHLGAVMLSLHFEEPRKQEGKGAIIYTAPAATPASQRFSASLVDALEQGIDGIKVEGKSAPFWLLTKPLITAVVFETTQPLTDQADAELAKMADALAAGISAWSKLPPQPPAAMARGALDIEAGDVDYDSEKNTIVATGNVHVRFNDDTPIDLKAERAEYDMGAGKLKLWAATAEAKTKNGEVSYGKAGIIEYDEKAGVIKFSNQFELTQGHRRITSKDDKSHASLEIATGKLKINGPTITKLVLPDKAAE